MRQESSPWNSYEQKKCVKFIRQKSSAQNLYAQKSSAWNWYAKKVVRAKK